MNFDCLQNLRSEDLVLVIFDAKFHKKILLEAAAMYKVVCIDGTHGTNSYAFQLVSLLVKDKTGKGCPVGHMICTTDSEVTNTVFLENIRKACGTPIYVDSVMSDMARAYHNAWCNVMHKPTGDFQIQKPTAIKCIWHVLRAWKAHENNIKDKKIEKEIDNMLRTMLETNMLKELIK